MTRRLYAFAVCLAAAGLAPAHNVPVSSRTLENGMKLLVYEDHNIPNVALYLFFRVGSRNEKPGITGISHFLEHMMFNGSKKYGPGEFDEVMEKNGGSNNAYTTRDVTVYSDWFSTPALELVVSMEAERMQSLLFDPAAIEPERKVVLSERRVTVENDNSGFLQEQLFATLFREHPYRWPVLGWERDIQSWTAADLRDYFRRGYGPNNCVLVAAGDITLDELSRVASKHFAAVPGRGLPPPVGPPEPEQRQERRIDVERPAHAPHQLIAFHVPPSAHPDYWPLQVAGTVLASGHSSRLYHRLVRGHHAMSVSFWQSLSLDPGAFVLGVDWRQDANPSDVEKAFDDEIHRLMTVPVAHRELRAAKNKLLTDHAREIRTNSGKADWLGSYEIFFGDYRKLLSAPQEIERVSEADVQRVARAYFQTANRTVATLKPAAVHGSRGASR